MNDVVLRIIASIISAGLFCLSTAKLVGAMQQSGYKNKTFWAWLKRKDNLFFNRLCVWAICIALTCSVTALCFSFLGKHTALLISALPFMGLGLLFCYVDEKFALKVPTKNTGRCVRLSVLYAFFTACAAYAFIAFLWFLAKWNGSLLYGLIAYMPFAVMPVLQPFLLLAANAVDAVFENARNKKFVKRAGQVLDERKIIRIGVVGSYGKTSVKNILKTLLLEKYTVVETPESYNTPMGVAKTVFSPEFTDKQVFIAEMGARKAGDIKELCNLVKPDYAIFTGVCEQHIATFGSLDGVWTEKKEIFKSGAKKVVCGAALKGYLETETDVSNAVFTDAANVKNVSLLATKTCFTLCVNGEEVAVETPLLGQAAVENILLAATLAAEMGLSAQGIAQGVKKLQPIPHRLQLLENNGVYILDDGYNCNPRGAVEALAALGRFNGRKCVVTPGIVECGVLEENVNGTLGKQLATAKLDKIILVGETLIGSVKQGYDEAQGEENALMKVRTLNEAQEILKDWLQPGDAVLFLNDLPDVY